MVAPRAVLVALILAPCALAVESMPAGAWASVGLQMAAAPEEISTPLHRDVIAISGGETHSMALTRAGRVVAWGSNIDGQLNLPATVANGVSAIAAGGRFCAALKDGRVITWGATHSNPQLSVPGAATSGVIRIAAGWNHMLALKSNGAVVAWGANAEGQCEVPEDALTGVKAIAASGVQSVALKEDGRVISWGNQSMGGLTTPLEAQSGVAAVVAGYEFILALKEDGTTLAWGTNISDQITVPVEAQGGVVAIAAGAEHALALTSGGKVVAWGWNYFGQIDVPAAALSDVVAIAAGEAHSVALKADGTVLAWGSDHANQTLPGIASGKASAIAAGGAATFRKMAQPWPSFAEAAALAGLGGADAEPGAIPFGDGVSNLLKHAFNLELALPFTGAMAAGSPSGLPGGELIQDEMGSYWRVEFIRRKDPRLTYTPTISTSLADGSFVPSRATPRVEEILGFPAWQRVTLDEPVDLSATPRIFSRMELE